MATSFSEWLFTELEEEKLKVKETKSGLEEAEQIRGRGQTLNRNGIPEIRKVQPYLRNRTDFAKYYSPKLISMGPIHSRNRDGQERLRGGERYKMRWAAMYLEDTNQGARSLFEKIRTQLPALMEMYPEEEFEVFRRHEEEELRRRHEEEEEEVRRRHEKEEEELRRRHEEEDEELRHRYEEEEEELRRRQEEEEELRRRHKEEEEEFRRGHEEVLKWQEGWRRREKERVELRRREEEEKLVRMFLLDGCALLEFIRNHKEGTAFAEAKLQIKGDQLVLVQQDLLLFENQLPYQLLTLLSNVPENELNQWIVSFLKTCPMATSTTDGTGSSKGSEEVKITVDGSQPPHLLHLLRQYILGYSDYKSNKDGGGSGCGKREKFLTYRNIQELKAAGIKVKRSDSKCPIHVTFSTGWLSGELRLPTIHLDLTTPSTYLNLMAYEVCPDFDNNFEITSYVQFLTSMIKYPDDVKELRSCGCMINFYGNDVEIANFFNFISAHSVPNAALCHPVRPDIERYFRSRYRTWLAQAYHAYFSNSGSFIAFIAASVALVLTFIQTWFTVGCSK